MTDEYRPAEYWSERLGADCSLRGTGHIAYSEAYNDWLYRAKRRALDRALGGLTPGRALDVGSGVGWVVAELLRRGYRVEGCDIAPVAVDALRRRFPDVPFSVVALGTDPLPGPPAAFDLVTLLDVAYHVTDDEQWARGVDHLAGALRPGGALVVIDGFGATDVVPASHVRFRSEPRWRSVARDAGLELTRLVPCYRWLSRDRETGGPLRRLPDGVRGAIEYGLELAVPRRPHMRCALFTRTASRPAG